MKKHLILALTALTIVGSGCSDDEVEEPFLLGNEQANFDGRTYSISGFGNGVDITSSIGNIKEQVLNLELLYKDKAIELDLTASKNKIYRTGTDYVKMNNEINACLAGTLNNELPETFFSWNLYERAEEKTRRYDIYEFGTCMLINKQFALNIKSQFHSQLKSYVNETAWNEINATDADNRTDKAAIKALFDKYGTHIATKTFYGVMYQYILFRENNEWESSMEAQMEIGLNTKCPIPETGMKINGKNVFSTSQVDDECYKNSTKQEVEQRIGGDNNIEDMNEWFESCTQEDISTCALLGYSFGLDESGESGLIPLYELLDKSDDRKTAMKEALNEYVQEKSIVLENTEMVLIDAFGKHFESGDAPEYLYQDYKVKKLKYFRLDEEISQHVRAITKGKFYFYYSLGYLTEESDEAVVDMKFGDSAIHGRGDHAGEGVSGYVKKHYLCTLTKRMNDVESSDKFVTGFGVKVDGEIAGISRGTKSDFNWIQNGELWYKGLVHDDVYCIYTKDQLKKDLIHDPL